MSADNDRRLAWLKEKVITALGVTDEQFAGLGAQGPPDGGGTITDLVALLDSSKTAGCIFYCAADLREIEVEGR